MNEPRPLITPSSIATAALAVLHTNPFNLTEAQIAANLARADERCECCGQSLSESA